MAAKRIDYWIKLFGSLYSRSDRGRKPEEYWIATMAHCSGIGESIRRVDYPELIKSAAHAFCWICCFNNHLRNNKKDLLFYIDHSLCDIVFFKFPNICGHCFRNPCQCDPYKTDQKKDKAANYKRLLKEWTINRKVEGHTIEEWLSIFRAIYGGQNHLLTLESIGFHFLEEGGEEALAIRQLMQLRGKIERWSKEDKLFLNRICKIEGLVDEYDKCARDDNGKPRIDMKSGSIQAIKNRIIKAKMDLVIELADTFSWFCAIQIKMLRILETIEIKKPEDYDLEEFLKKEYKLGKGKLSCPTCKEGPCKCRFYPKTS